MTHCSEMARSSWVEIGMAAYGLHAVSDPLVHFFQSRANSLIWSWFPQVKYTVSPVSAPCTAKWEHLRIPGANAVGKAAQGLRLRASLHAESSWSPPTWQNRINRKVLIWSKADFFFFSFCYFSLVNNLVSDYQKLLELSTLSLSRPYIFKMEWKKGGKKNAPKWFFLSFASTVTLPTEITKKLKLIKAH